MEYVTPLVSLYLAEYPGVTVATFKKMVKAMEDDNEALIKGLMLGLGGVGSKDCKRAIEFFKALTDAYMLRTCTCGGEPKACCKPKEGREMRFLLYLHLCQVDNKISENAKVYLHEAADLGLPCAIYELARLEKNK